METEAPPSCCAFVGSVASSVCGVADACQCVFCLSLYFLIDFVLFGLYVLLSFLALEFRAHIIITTHINPAGSPRSDSLGRAVHVQPRSSAWWRSSSSSSFASSARWWTHLPRSRGCLSHPHHG